MNLLKRATTVIALASTLGLTACAPKVDGVNSQDAATLLTQKAAVMVDVREPDEWREKHINGAIHIPLGQVESRLRELAQYKDQTVIMQCRSGRRSAEAAGILKTAGFTKVYNLEGGILAWEESGQQVIKQ